MNHPKDPSPPAAGGDETHRPALPPTPEQLLGLLWQQAPDHAIVLLDLQGQVIGWRGAATSMFGYEESEVLGRTLDFLFIERDRELGMPQQERSVALAAGASEDDRWHVRKDGSRLWVFGSVIRLLEHGRPVGFAKLMSDRTNQRSQYETLENRLEGARRDLSLRDVFFGRLTHEVRNSLGPIRSVAELIERSDSSGETRLALAVVRRQVDQMERMMRDLAEVARLGAGKLQLQKAPLDLGAQVAEIVESLRPQAVRKSQQLSVLLPSGPIAIEADRHRLHQIVFNLVHNAIKYTPKEGRIWVHCAVEADYGVVKVEDTGVGISPEVMPTIFELFTQENPHQSEGGFGVGLSLVKDLVDAHDGFVEAACDGKGKGAMFIVRLPMAG